MTFQPLRQASISRPLRGPFDIRENLGRPPAADRLRVNMLHYAGRDGNQPLAGLSPD